MFGRRTNGKAIFRGKSLFRLLVRVVVGFVLAVLLIVAAVEAWIIPGIIRHKAEQRLSRFCEGRVVIEHAEKRRSGQIALEQIRFLDKGQREWLTVEKARAVLSDWPSLSPTVEDVAIDGLNLRLSVVEGKVTWPPVRLPQPPAGASGGPRIPKLAINRGAITVVDAEGSSTVYGDLMLAILQMGGGQYEFSLNHTTGDGSELLLAKGGFNVHSADFDVRLQMKHHFAKPEMALPLTALGAPAVSAEGDLFAELSVTGFLKNLERWRPKGTVRLRDWVVAENGTVAWNSLSMDVEVGPSGLGFENVTIGDANGVEWFGTRSARLALANWPGRRPVVTQIELQGPKLRASVTDGRRFTVAAWLPKDTVSDPNAGPSSLQRLAIHDAAIAVEDPNGPLVLFDKLWVDAVQQTEGSYDIMVARRGPNDSNAVAVKGLVSLADSQATLSLKADYVTKKAETAIAFAAMGKPQYALEGKLVADLALDGHLNKPLELHADGSAKLDECTVFFKEGTLADKLAATATFSGRRLNIENYEAAMCDGRVSGYFHADVNEGGRTSFRGRVLAVNVNFPKFSSVLTAKAKAAAQGTFTASYAFAGQRNGTTVFNGDGLIFFDDTDVRILPVVPQIFASAGLAQYEPLKMSDMEATFTTIGPVVTIHSGHISNNFAAIEFEPGGTIDLRARQIDGYVVAAPLSQIAGAVEGLPIINILARVKDKLMRLHVKGNWADPPGKLITKEPVKDLKEGTVGFIQDVVKGSGQLGRGMLDTIGGLFKTKQDKSK